MCWRSAATENKSRNYSGIQTLQRSHQSRIKKKFTYCFVLSFKNQNSALAKQHGLVLIATSKEDKNWRGSHYNFHKESKNQNRNKKQELHGMLQYSNCGFLTFNKTGISFLHVWTSRLMHLLAVFIYAVCISRSS